MSAEELRFTINGPPVAWHRPPNTRFGRGIDHKDKAYQTLIGNVVRAQVIKWEQRHGVKWDVDGEWIVDMDIYVHNLIRRDKDNVEKNINDGLVRGKVFKDDSKIVDGRIRMFLSRENPRIIVSIRRTSGHLDTDHP